jgi:hypothetical protein
MDKPKPSKRRSPPMTWDQLQHLALKLPGAEPGTSFGTPAIKVKGKLLARLREDGETAMVRCSFGERDMLIQTDPRSFTTTDHYRNYASVLVRLDSVQPGMLQDVLEWGWRMIAPKRLQQTARPPE